MNCKQPLPPDCSPNRRFHNAACRKQFWRARHGAKTIIPRSIAENMKLPTNHTDPLKDLPEDLLSLTQPEILRLPTTPSIIALILKAKLELGMAQHRIVELERIQAKREDTVLDPDTARRAARFLATNGYAS